MPTEKILNFEGCFCYKYSQNPQFKHQFLITQGKIGEKKYPKLKYQFLIIEGKICLLTNKMAANLLFWSNLKSDSTKCMS